jgi:hypothetical protein
VSDRWPGRVRIGASVLSRQLEGETVIVDTDGGEYFGLDEVGTRIWAWLQEDLTLSQVLDRLEAEYAMPRDQLARDLLSLVDDLTAAGLVTEVAGAVDPSGAGGD